VEFALLLFWGFKVKRQRVDLKYEIEIYNNILFLSKMCVYNGEGAVCKYMLET